MNSVCVITVLFLASLSSSYPLHDDVDMADIMTVKTLDRFKVHFSWRNISCPVCKAVFTVVDIALLVRKLSFMSPFVFVQQNSPTYIKQNILSISGNIKLTSKHSSMNIWSNTRFLMCSLFLCFNQFWRFFLFVCFFLKSTWAMVHSSASFTNTAQLSVFQVTSAFRSMGKTSSVNRTGNYSQNDHSDCDACVLVWYVRCNRKADENYRAGCWFFCCFFDVIYNSTDIKHNNLNEFEVWRKILWRNIYYKTRFYHPVSNFLYPV